MRIASIVGEFNQKPCLADVPATKLFLDEWRFPTCVEPPLAAGVEEPAGAASPPPEAVDAEEVPPDALDAEEVPPDALVYATRRAAERLPSGWHEGRVVTVPRAFSAETARALLTFLVRRNLQAAR